MDKLEDIGQKIVEMPNQLICAYWEDKKIHTIGIDIDKNEHITVLFDKGYVVVKTETETKFVCKGKLFISLWK